MRRSLGFVLLYSCASEEHRDTNCNFCSLIFVTVINYRPCLLKHQQKPLKMEGLRKRSFRSFNSNPDKSQMRLVSKNVKLWKPATSATYFFVATREILVSFLFYYFHYEFLFFLFRNKRDLNSRKIPSNRHLALIAKEFQEVAGFDVNADLPITDAALVVGIFEIKKQNFRERAARA